MLSATNVLIKQIVAGSIDINVYTAQLLWVMFIGLFQIITEVKQSLSYSTVFESSCIFSKTWTF